MPIVGALWNKSMTLESKAVFLVADKMRSPDMALFGKGSHFGKRPPRQW